MRIAVIGDLQNDTIDNIKKVADDINTLSPDYVVIVGDYGMYDTMGTYENFRDIADAFKDVNCKRFVPLLGNHDVQFENGEIKYSPGTVYKNYTDAFGFAPDNAIIETENAAICCVHLNPQTKEKYIHINECTVSDDRFEDIKNKLGKIKDKPIIMITHTPPACAEIICVPQVHIRATNAYLDQDHNFSRWIELSKSNRNILLWLSGHYHMGHHYPKSLNVKDGLAYMTVGCPVAASRDNQLHTRIIDIDSTNITVRTYDHTCRALLPTADYQCSTDFVRGEYEECTAPLCIGCGKAVHAAMSCDNRLFVMTDDGYLWEVNLENRFTAGTIHYSQMYRLDGFKLGENCIWRICGDKMFCHDLNDPYRFMREYDSHNCRYTQSELHRAEEYIHPHFVYNSGNNTFKLYNDTYSLHTDSGNMLWIVKLNG